MTYRVHVGGGKLVACQTSAQVRALRPVPLPRVKPFQLRREAERGASLEKLAHKYARPVSRVKAAIRRSLLLVLLVPALAWAEDAAPDRATLNRVHRENAQLKAKVVELHTIIDLTREVARLRQEVLTLQDEAEAAKAKIKNMESAHELELRMHTDTINCLYGLLRQPVRPKVDPCSTQQGWSK